MAAPTRMSLVGVPDFVRELESSNVYTAGGQLYGASFLASNVDLDDFDSTFRPRCRCSLDNRVTVNFGGGYFCEGFGVVIPTVIAGSRWRVIASDSSGADFGGIDTAVVPTSVVSSSNLTGTYTDVDDDPDSPDANWMTATVAGTPTSVVLGMGSPTLGTGGTELLGWTDADTIHTQTIAVWVRCTGAPATPPTIDVTLEESSVFKIRPTIVYDSDYGSSGWDPGYVSSETGQLLIYAFDPSDLSDKTGASADISIVCTASGGHSVEIGAVRWYAAVDGVGADGDIDSGIKHFQNDDIVLETRLSSRGWDRPRGINWADSHLLTATSSIWQFQIQFFPYVDTLTAGAVFNHACGQYDDIARVYCGEVYTTPKDMIRGWRAGVLDFSTASRTRLGSTLTKFTFMKRKFTASFQYLEENDALLDVLMWLGMGLGQTKSALLVPLPADTTGSRSVTTIPVRVANGVELQNSAPGRMGTSIDFEEW